MKTNNPVTAELIDYSDCLSRVKAKLYFLSDMLISPTDNILTKEEIISGLGIILLELLSQVNWLEKVLDDEFNRLYEKISILEHKLEARKCA